MPADRLPASNRSNGIKRRIYILLTWFIVLWWSNRWFFNQNNEKTADWIEAGIIRDLDAITRIESAKSDITCNDTYIVSCLHYTARHHKFIDNNVNVPYFTTCVWQLQVISPIIYVKCDSWNNLLPEFGT